MRHVLLLLSLAVGACGGGVPITVRIDEFQMELDLDETVAGVEQQLIGSGVLPLEIAGLPELWPADELPHIQYTASLDTPPIAVDLTPDDPNSSAAKKYADINKYADAIRRVEINHLVLRYEANDANMAFPALKLQVAAQADASPDDRLAWYTVGQLPSQEPGFVGDVPFEFARGGESYFSAQLMDEERAFALRAAGSLEIDTEQNPRRPRGKISVRMIVETTFFVEPDTLYGTLKE